MHVETLKQQKSLFMLVSVVGKYNILQNLFRVIIITYFKIK